MAFLLQAGGSNKQASCPEAHARDGTKQASFAAFRQEVTEIDGAAFGDRFRPMPRDS
jgi:hypothetical protein